MSKVFLGGTCNDSTWRDDLIPKLKIDYFNLLPKKPLPLGRGQFTPVVDDWNKEAQQEEIKERKNSDYVLYVITPKMSGVYSIAEVVDDSNKRPEKTLFCVLNIDDENEFTVG